MASPSLTGDSRLGVLHVHSDYSHDGKDSLESLRDWALEKGIGCVWLTDHAEDFSAERFSEFERRCQGLSDERLILVPGLEFRFAGFKGLHLLAAGLRSWIAPTTPAEFIAAASGAAALTVVAHPILANYQIPDVVWRGIGAIEVWNGGYNTRYLPDPRALQLVRYLRRQRPEAVGTVGPDQHALANDRELRIELPPSLPGATSDATAELRAGRFTNRGRTMTIAPDCELTPLRFRTLEAARVALDAAEGLQVRARRWRRALGSAGRTGRDG